MSFPDINRLARASQDLHDGENSFLDRPWEQAYTCLKASPRRLKRCYQVFPAHKQACTTLIRPPQWGKLLSRSSLALNQASMCFTASPPGLKRWYQAQACTNLIGLPQRSKLHSRSTLELKQACTCFRVPQQRFKRRYHVFSAHKQACTSLTVPPQW